MALRPRPTTVAKRAQIRHCLHSECDTAKDMTPIYLCEHHRSKGPATLASAPAKARACVLYDEAFCKDHETFPGRFDT